MPYFLTSNPMKDGKLNDANAFTCRLNKTLPKEIRLLFISSQPDGHEKNVYYGHEMKKCFMHSGFDIVAFDILDGRNKDQAGKKVEEADGIILSGGHVPTQNAFFEEINLKEILKISSDKVIIGVSAGSMNCASQVYALPEREGEAVSKEYKRFLKGLGITKTNIIPHFSDLKKESLDGLRLIEDIVFQDSFGQEYIAISDGSYVYGNGQEEILYGEGFLIKNATIEKISSDNAEYRIDGTC